MTYSHPVLVYWSEEKQRQLPISGQYITVARFLGDEASHLSDAWSIVLNIRGDVHAQPCKADAEFLSQKAPHEKLQSGAEFELFEGNLKTATVKVL